MIRRNIDVTLGLVNGTIAMISAISRDIDTQEVKALHVTLPNGKEHVIERASVTFEVIAKSYVIRKQFPISLSYGITIHKSQGLSLSSAVIDIGNSIFTRGQTYVALSRLKSIEGLHLINFDPASVKADESAIVEYNRLRESYRPDLPHIDTSTKCYGKISDKQWAARDINQDALAAPQFGAEELLSSIIVKGFTNDDKVSCYANAVLQNLLHCECVGKELSKCPDASSVKYLLNDHNANKRVLNSRKVRDFVGEPFSRNEQQDAAVFLRVLCSKVDLLRNVLGHDLSVTVRCTKCDYTVTTTQENVIATLQIPFPLPKNSNNLEYLMKHNFSRWSSAEGTCEHCRQTCERRIKNEIVSAKQVIVLQIFMVPEENNAGENRKKKGLPKTSKCSLIGVPRVGLPITGNIYKVTSAVFYHERNTDQRYYTSMLKLHEKNKVTWLQVHDHVVLQKRWPVGSKDAYMFFLQK